MLNNIAIGTSATLDLQARTLSRLHDGKSVTLPVSACNCLKALVEAREDVLSQEQLMDVGWRNSGVEVTENSIRVMINKIRRALVSLDMQDSITLLAVTRSGYRLIIRESHGSLNDIIRPAQSEEIPQPEPVATPSELSTPPPAPAPRRKPFLPPVWKRRIFGALGGLVLGTLVALLIGWMVKVAPDHVIFTRWTGEGAPAGTEVWIPADHQSDGDMIRTTLELYSEYALKREAKSEKANHLYITVGQNAKFLGLIACIAPLQDSENNCESYYFRYH
ncbi:MAG TPA: winged helix-turn-helix domain-containing protein [Buttiauxella sp.]|jgi:DNA-binding winged helix-turn-helix (wHTH) protein